jgi:hypothetical protein
MQGDEIEIGQAFLQQVGESFFQEGNIAQFSGLGNLPCVGDMFRVQIHPPEAAVGVGGGQNIGGQAVAAAQFAVGEALRQLARRVAVDGGDVVEPDRGELAVVTGGVGDVGDVFLVHGETSGKAAIIANSSRQGELALE